MEASVVREAVAGNADPKDLPVRSPAGEPTSMSEKISPDHPKADLGFPEGGLRAWLVVLGTGLVLSSTVGLVSSWGVSHAQVHCGDALLLTVTAGPAPRDS